MMRSRFCTVALGVFVVGALTGCSGAGSVEFGAATIPSGEWRGRGNYVACKADSAKKVGPIVLRRTQDGAYETWLRITKRKLFGREGVVVEIRSKRGKIFESKETETHLRILLLPIKTMDRGAAFYAVADLELNPKGPPDYEAREAHIREWSQMPSASCVRVGSETCLQVQYLPADDGAFTDAFVFDGDRLLKTGMLVETKTKEGKTPELTMGQVYWVERLVKAK